MIAFLKKLWLAEDSRVNLGRNFIRVFGFVFSIPSADRVIRTEVLTRPCALQADQSADPERKRQSDDNITRNEVLLHGPAANLKMRGFAASFAIDQQIPGGNQEKCERHRQKQSADYRAGQRCVGLRCLRRASSPSAAGR